MLNPKVFQWHPETRVHAGGRKLVLPCADDTNPQIAALNALHRAISARQEFVVTEAGIDLLPDVTSHFQTTSGGSTGAPKSIRRSHGSWIESFEVNRRLFNLGPADRFAVFGGLMHSLALYGLAEALHIGADIHLMAGLRPDRQADMVLGHAITLLYITPTQLRLLCAAGPLMPSVRRILCGGGVLSPETRAMAGRRFPNATLREFYGASETSFITLSDGDTPEGSVGRAYPGVEIRIEKDVAGDCGLVWVKSPYLFEGYAQGASPDTRWRDGFLTVGELGEMDDAGHLFLRGRKTRMVTIADRNVFPEQIEALILDLEGVTHCAVLAVPDTRRGHRLVAVLDGPSDPALAQRVVDRCRARLSPLKAPREVLFHAEFPLLPSGKPDIRALSAFIEDRS